MIKTIKFGNVKQWIAFIFSLFHVIKWIIILFCSKESEMANLLGDFGYFYGPKLVNNLIFLICSISVEVTLLFYYFIILLFYYSLKYSKKIAFLV